MHSELDGEPCYVTVGVIRRGCRYPRYCPLRRKKKRRRAAVTKIAADDIKERGYN